MGDAVFETTRATFDPAARTFYLCPGGSVLRPVHLAAVPPSFGADVEMDCSGCDGGKCCFSELHWDPTAKTILALGIGFGPSKVVALVRIDPGTGAVAAVEGASVQADCAVTLDASTFDTATGIFFALVDCGSDEHYGELVAFDGRGGRGRLPDALSGKIYDTNPVFHAQSGGLFAFDGDECLVAIAHNKTTRIGKASICSKGGVGGIPVAFGVAPRGDSEVFVTIQNMEKRLLAHVSLVTGETDHVAVPLDIQHLFYDDDGDTTLPR